VITICYKRTKLWRYGTVLYDT